MEIASFTGFIKTIFILFLIYYALKILFRIFAPIILQRIVKKAEHNFRERNNQYDQQNTSSKGVDKSDTSTFGRPRETKKVGDYVDYEEID